MNMSKSVWMAFVLHFPILIACLLEQVVTYFNVYAKLEGTRTNEAVFLKRQNLIFSTVARSIYLFIALD